MQSNFAFKIYLKIVKGKILQKKLGVLKILRSGSFFGVVGGFWGGGGI